VIIPEFKATTGTTARNRRSEAETTIARVVDAQLGHPVNDGWQGRIQGNGQGQLERAEHVLTKAEELMQKQQWKQVCNLIPSNQALLSNYPYHAAQAGMLLAQAQRRIGKFEASAQTWQQTAVLTARMASNWPAPSLWEQLAAARPVSTSWPAEVAVALLPFVPAPLHSLVQQPSFPAEAILRFAIGEVRLRRSEASSALSAFNRADSQGTSPVWDEFIRLHQAKTLLVLEQAPAATSQLTVLTQDAASVWRLPALALLGSGKLQQGHSRQAIAFLREACEKSDADFLWRADAEANLGLAYLMTGDEANGLRWLHQAQQRFIQIQDHAGLRQAIENEANYLELAGKTTDAQRVRQSMREMQ
jgi:tetratricopeptide (TPR) repeat protein